MCIKIYAHEGACETRKPCVVDLDDENPLILYHPFEEPSRCRHASKQLSMTCNTHGHCCKLSIRKFCSKKPQGQTCWISQHYHMTVACGKADVLFESLKKARIHLWKDDFGDVDPVESVRSGLFDTGAEFWMANNEARKTELKLSIPNPYDKTDWKAHHADAIRKWDSCFADLAGWWDEWSIKHADEKMEVCPSDGLHDPLWKLIYQRYTGPMITMHNGVPSQEPPRFRNTGERNRRYELDENERVEVLRRLADQEEEMDWIHRENRALKEEMKEVHRRNHDLKREMKRLEEQFDERFELLEECQAQCLSYEDLEHYGYFRAPPLRARHQAVGEEIRPTIESSGQDSPLLFRSMDWNFSQNGPPSWSVSPRTIPPRRENDTAVESHQEGPEHKSLHVLPRPNLPRAAVDPPYRLPVPVWSGVPVPGTDQQGSKRKRLEIVISDDSKDDSEEDEPARKIQHTGEK